MSDYSLSAALIRRHYALDRAVTPREVRDEIADLRRKALAGSMDDLAHSLFASLSRVGALNFDALGAPV